MQTKLREGFKSETDLKTDFMVINCPRHLFIPCCSGVFLKVSFSSNFSSVKVQLFLSVGVSLAEVGLLDFSLHYSGIVLVQLHVFGECVVSCMNTKRKPRGAKADCSFFCSNQSNRRRTESC